MTNQPTNAGTDSPKMQAQAQTQGADIKRALLKDIRVKWGKFTEQELSDLKDNDDLVSHLAAKYGMEKSQAQREVNQLRAGRNI
jgi:division protein CdvB (Snf7/Vps24/ESCRT-III family)